MSDNSATSQADSSTDASKTDAQKTDQESAKQPTEVKDLPQWAQDHIKSLRTEAATHRTKAQQLEDAGKTELQRITDERDRLKTDLTDRETRLKGLAIANVLTDALSKAGARHPSLLVKDLVTKADVDDELNVKNVDKLVADAKKAYPDMFRVVEGKADGGEGRDDGAGKTTNMNRLIRRQAGYAA